MRTPVPDGGGGLVELGLEGVVPREDQLLPVQPAPVVGVDLQRIGRAGRTRIDHLGDGGPHLARVADRRAQAGAQGLLRIGAAADLEQGQGALGLGVVVDEAGHFTRVDLDLKKARSARWGQIITRVLLLITVPSGAWSIWQWIADKLQ